MTKRICTYTRIHFFEGAGNRFGANDNTHSRRLSNSSAVESDVYSKARVYIRAGGLSVAADTYNNDGRSVWGDITPKRRAFVKKSQVFTRCSATERVRRVFLTWYAFLMLTTCFVSATVPATPTPNGIWISSSFALWTASLSSADKNTTTNKLMTRRCTVCLFGIFHCFFFFCDGSRVVRVFYRFARAVTSL